MKEMTTIRKENFKKLSKRFGSQRAFADALDTTPGYVNQLLNGHRSIGELRLLAITITYIMIYF